MNYLLTTLILSASLVWLTGLPVQASSADEHWVATWTAAPQLTEPGNMPPPPGLGDTTLRQVVHVTLGGSRIRVRFSNAFATSNLTITSAHVALPSGPGAIDTTTDRPLTFAGASAVTIPAGAPIVSDPLDFALAPHSNLTITIHVTDPSQAVTGHPGSRTTSYLQAGDSVTASNLPTAVTTAHWYYIAGVDVVAPPGASAVVTLGDSLTDGRGSTTDGNDRWPDVLAARLAANRRTRDVAVLNAGIGGNRVLHPGLGPSVLERLDRDVLVQAGARWAIVFEGVNDIGTHSATANDLIAAYQQIIVRAHARGLLVYGATITPFGGSFYDSPDHAAIRHTVNDWIRSSGAFDAVVDFDAAVRDPANPDHVLASDDSGDHLHLNPSGYQRLAGAIDLKLFEK
jgi:lysophospholipase L1-like esterase